MRVTDGIPLGCSLLLPVDTVNYAATLQGFNKLTEKGTVRVFEQKITLGHAIGSHACSLQALACV